MCTRPITALLAALALLAVTPAAAFAQTPTPTATAAQDDGAAADPPADASKEVKAVYTDYSRDGVIDVCDHTRDVLQETLDGIEPDFDRDFPDFREAVRAGIQRHDKGRCDDDAEPTATPTPTATASPTATATASPTASPESGALPPTDDSGGKDGGAAPPDTGSTTPEDGSLPTATATPPAATATVAPPVAATTPTPVPTPAVVTRSSTDGLLLPGILIGIALLGAAALAVSAYTGRRSPRMRHAWSEAAYRTKSTWADFSDWLRLGR